MIGDGQRTLPRLKLAAIYGVATAAHGVVVLDRVLQRGAALIEDALLGHPTLP